QSRSSQSRTTSRSLEFLGERLKFHELTQPILWRELEVFSNERAIDVLLVRFDDRIRLERDDVGFLAGHEATLPPGKIQPHSRIPFFSSIFERLSRADDELETVVDRGRRGDSRGRVRASGTDGERRQGLDRLQRRAGQLEVLATQTVHQSQRRQAPGGLDVSV